MTTVFAYSDSHGKPLSPETEAVMACCDYMFFLGDGLNENAKYCQKYAGRYFAVKGNCDRLSAPEETLLEIEGVKLLLTHGHLQGVKGGLLNLLYRAKELGANAVVYGHTHIFSETQAEGVKLINAGSYQNSVYGDNGYAFITVEKQTISAKFVKTA